MNDKEMHDNTDINKGNNNLEILRKQDNFLKFRLF